MADNVPDNAPPGTDALVEWAEAYADQVGVASSEEAGTYEVTVQFENSSLLLAGVLGQDGDPGLWESASLAHWDGVETDAVLDIPEQLPEPPVIVADDDSTVTVQSVNAEIELSRGEGTEGGGGGEGEESDGGGGSNGGGEGEGDE